MIHILSYSVLILFLIVIIYSGWILYIRGAGRNEEWKVALREGKISGNIQRMEFFYPDKIRFFAWWSQAERLKKNRIEGAYAELGVYKGDSARILHYLDPSRKFHLFDTFTGFTEKDLAGETGEAATYQPSNFADTYINKVLTRISGNENIILHPGYFPDTAAEVASEQFALVNLDADLYAPTRAGLEFFYPRLAKGGVIFVHDYNNKWPGILKAVDEFAATIPGELVRVNDKEGTIMIIKSED
ncbi:MAG TPA: TylF/MycF/NovP-related O-methyltransferase [Bacteroidales bacterium]|nr:TylF/MycF/NovP-related O-methyltransferase [Bacteroidales bacterium]